MTEIELPVIEFRKSLASTIYRITFIVTVVGFLVAVFLTKDDNHIIGKLFLGVLLTFIIIGFFLPKSTFSKGGIKLSKENFTYCLNGHETKYPLSEISQITLLYDGYAGRTRNISLTIHDSGDDNKLSFKFQGLTVSYNLRIEHSYLGLIRRLLMEIEGAGKTVNVLNSNKEIIKI